jgi:hypothetical protein
MAVSLASKLEKTLKRGKKICSTSVQRKQIKVENCKLFYLKNVISKKSKIFEGFSIFTHDHSFGHNFSGVNFFPTFSPDLKPS